MLLGHFAVSALLHRYMKVGLKPTMLGGIFPDIVDKTLCQGLHITPSGRMYAHTLLGLGVTSAAIAVLRSPKAAFGWALGYLGHLVADSTGFVPWFYPFNTYRFNRSTSTFFSSFGNMFARPKWIEWILLIWAAWVFLQGRRVSDELRNK